MKPQLEITGFLGVTFLTVGGGKLSKRDSQLVLSGLKDGDFTIDLNTRKIYEGNTPIYSFEFTNTEDVEMDWDDHAEYERIIADKIKNGKW